MKVSASLVLFKNDPKQFGQAIDCFLSGCDGELIVVDNSPVPLEHGLLLHPRVSRLVAGGNLGFGRAHNLALRHLAGRSDVHLFLNPDVSFDGGVVPSVLDFFRKEAGVGALMPRVVYADGRLQRLCKLLPTPGDLFLRRFLPSAVAQFIVNGRYELHGLPQDRPSIVPSLSGCFLFVNTKLLGSLGGFDERYFMYMEDVDLVRRVGDVAEVVYFPTVCVTHGYSKGSYRDTRLLIYHVRSAISYFNKWGWIIDRVRRRRNSRALEAIVS